MEQWFKGLLVGRSTTLREALRAMDKGEQGILLVVDEAERLVGTISDGDVRRAVLRGVSLEDQVDGLLESKKGSQYERPITASLGATADEIRDLMRESKIRHLPLLDKDGRVRRLATWEDVLPREPHPVRAVVMAGGEGQRLRPLTEDIPKPMLRIADRPLLEHVLDGIRTSGIYDVCISTRYKTDVIREYFGTGENVGLHIEYLTEDEPRGTAGALSETSGTEGPLLVVNGDVLTNLDYRLLLDFHRSHGADMTVAVRKYDVSIPYGVVECDGEEVTGIGEKPVLGFLVNAGIYLLEPDVVRLVPRGGRYDMIQLIEQLLIADGRRVAAFPIIEYWLDIGQHESYEKAKSDLANGGFPS